jgi:hypothetical protein
LATDDKPLFACVVAKPLEASDALPPGAADVVIELGAMRMRLGPLVTPERAAALATALRPELLGTR